MYTEQLVARYMVKYSRLNEVIPKVFHGSTARAVNIYVDLYGLYRTILSRSYRTDISDYTAFTTSVINMCAHYRGYFKSIRVATKFFLTSSYNVSDINRKFVAEYNKTMCDKLKNEQVKEMLDLNLELLTILCPYLPDIHFLKTDFESTVLMMNIIQKEAQEGNKNPNIIISSDLYPLQLAILPNTVFLKPRKLNGGDQSMITYPYGHELHESSFWHIVCQERENLTLNRNNVMVSTPNFMLLMALTRFPERNFKSLLNFTTANKLLYNIIGDSTVTTPIETIYDLSKDLYTKVPLELSRPRFNCLEVLYQDKLFKLTVESSTIHYENLQDPDAVRLINDQYFSHNPIDIFRL